MVTENARCRKVAGVRFFACFAKILRKILFEDAVAGVFLCLQIRNYLVLCVLGA